ncbi:hypothetical protein IMY05_C4255000500 [Salix suchowensis]|nr:hypothetical protein IMY05_C4255000500 [Salix suchowensis]
MLARAGDQDWHGMADTRIGQAGTPQDWRQDSDISAGVLAIAGSGDWRAIGGFMAVQAAGVLATALAMAATGLAIGRLASAVVGIGLALRRLAPSSPAGRGAPKSMPTASGPGIRVPSGTAGTFNAGAGKARGAINSSKSDGKWSATGAGPGLCISSGMAGIFHAGVGKASRKEPDHVFNAGAGKRGAINPSKSDGYMESSCGSSSSSPEFGSEPKISQTNSSSRSVLAFGPENRCRGRSDGGLGRWVDVDAGDWESVVDWRISPPRDGGTRAREAHSSELWLDVRGACEARYITYCSKY